MNSLCILVLPVLVVTLYLSGVVDAQAVAAQTGYTPWTQWSRCSVSCTGGSQERFRDCYDGSLCGLGRVTENRNCNTNPCPVHGGWEPWESWIACTKLCGGGILARQRSCDAPSPAFGGRFCVGGVQANIDADGVEWETKPCNIHPCPVNGALTLWSAWSNCSLPCEGGRQTRIRTCTNPAPAHGGSVCIGETVDHRSCNSGIRCPVNGGWTLWTAWSYCSSSCAGGNEYRSRTCTNPFPLFGGLSCVGNDTLIRPCNSNILCPVHGKLLPWALWSGCSSTCAGGLMTRTRECTLPQHGGEVCVLRGDVEETEPCNSAVPCPVVAPPV